MCIAASISRRRTAVAALVSSLLGVAAFMAIPPGTAVATLGNYVCDRGEFCLGNYYKLTGGVYDSVGNQPDLRGKRYTYHIPTEDPRNPFVAIRWGEGGQESRAFSLSAYNNGKAVSSGLTDVMVYTWAGYTGHKACIVRTKRIDALRWDWEDRIMSFRWVTRAECNANRKL